ncbi:tyrosine--tRNA ligase 1, cytoplasmic-like protein [Tanacetum coccineum]
MSQDAIVVHEMFNGGVEIDIIVHEMFNGGVEITIVVLEMSQDAIVVHEMFNGRVEMLSLYMRCLTDESRCYRYTLDVQLMSRDAISAHEMFNGGGHYSKDLISSSPPKADPFAPSLTSSSTMTTSASILKSADAAGVVAGHVQNEGLIIAVLILVYTIAIHKRMLPMLEKVHHHMLIYPKDEANEKIQNAYCLPGIVEGNPCLEYIKYIVFPWFNKFEVERKEENGAFANYDELVAAYEEGDLHPDDLKHALSKALNEIFQVRKLLTSRMDGLKRS